MEIKNDVIKNMKPPIENKKALVQKNRHVVFTALLAFVLVVIAAIVGFGIGHSTVQDDITTNPQTEEGLSILSVTESGEWVNVKTSFITFRYPFAFSDIIELEAFNEGSSSQLRIYSKLDGQRILNYIVHFNDNEGLLCGTLKLKEVIPVSVEFKEVPKKLPAEWVSTFSAVQETFNDVLKSMEENGMVSVIE